MDKVKWGILSTAKIGIEQVIPAIQEADNCDVVAIASRTGEKAKKAAQQLEIPTAYDSYDKLFADSSIDAIYNPLPNHLHVPKTLDAMEAGKHVLCEKPIALDAQEAQQLIDVSKKHPELKVMEAFMYRFHPQWSRAKSMVDNKEIGELQTIESFFSYFNDDPDDIRNKAEMGGGGLMDIGCYCISLSRFLFDEEPANIMGRWKKDPEFGTDHLASGVLEFSTGTATFSCSTQSAPHQQVTIVGTEGRLIIEIPFNAPSGEMTRLLFIKDGEREEINFDPVDQYTIQAHEFSKAVLTDMEVPTPLDDALKNMEAIDAFRKSAEN